MFTGAALLGVLQLIALHAVVGWASSASMSVQRVAVVTGGNKGIGLEIVKKLAALPDCTCVLTSRNEKLGREALAKLEGDGLHPMYKQLDIGDPASVERFAAEMESEYGRVDVLVNNAGFAFKGSDPTPFMDQAEPTFKTNYFDTVGLTERMLPLVRKSSAGRIVNVSSRSGLLRIVPDPQLRAKFTSPSLTKEELNSLASKFVADVKARTHTAQGWPSSNYGMSKLCLTAYTKVVAREEKEKGTGVLVNSCCPGYCDTDMTSNKGPRPPEEGARTPFMLAVNLPTGGPTGLFFGEEAAIPW